MEEATRVHVRYDFPDERGETRRERNDRAGIVSPDLPLSQSSLPIWKWFFDIADGWTRVVDGVTRPIPHSEFLAWMQISGEIVSPTEYAILRDMDRVFCTELNKELQDYRERQAEQHKRDIEAARDKQNKGR